MLGTRPNAYEGSAPYVFVSYSHRDSGRVLPIIEGLQNKGIRVWYDEGIEVGSHWDKAISDRLSCCAYVVCFITANFLKSENCLDEIHFAKEYKKGPLIVYLENLVLPQEMQFRYGRLHALSLSQHSSVKALVDSLAETNLLSICRASSSGTYGQTDSFTSSLFGASSTSIKPAPAAPARSKASMSGKELYNEALGYQNIDQEKYEQLMEAAANKGYCNAYEKLVQLCKNKAAVFNKKLDYLSAAKCLDQAITWQKKYIKSLGRDADPYIVHQADQKLSDLETSRNALKNVGKFMKRHHIK